jgi:hypothetical protein
MTRSMNRHGISQKRFDRTSGLKMDAMIRRIVKTTNTPIEMFEIFTSIFPIFMKKIIGI